MTDQLYHEWLKQAVMEAAATYFGEEPQKVIIHPGMLTVALPAAGRPIHRVRAWVRMAEHSYVIFVNVAGDGSYSDFQIVEIVE